jgi:hypothetical protein
MRKIVLAAFLALFLSTAATGASSLRFQASFQIRERAEPCPPEYPAQSTTCYSLTSSATVRGLGPVTVTQRNIIDNAGGWRLRASGTFAVRGLGEISYAGDNSGHPGRNTFDFTFSGGTGRLAGATGGGTVTNSLTQSPVAFWEASLVADLTFDLAPPSLTLTKVTASRSGSQLRVRIGYRVTDASPPVALRAVVGRAARSSNALRSGAITLLVPARPAGTRITGRLTATDAVGNVATRSFQTVV